MKLTKSILREMIKDVLSEADVMDKTIKYKDKDGNEKEATVGGILKQGEDHPAYDDAQKMVGKDKGGEDKPEPKQTKISADPFADKDDDGGKPSKDDGGFDVGGPAYPNVPKGVKTSAQVKLNKSIDKHFSKLGASPRDLSRIGEDEHGNISLDDWETIDSVTEPLQHIRDNMNHYFEKSSFTDDPDSPGMEHPVLDKRFDGKYCGQEYCNGSDVIKHIARKTQSSGYPNNYIKVFKKEIQKTPPEMQKFIANNMEKLTNPETEGVFDSNPKESITSKLKREFKQYRNINKNLTRG